MVMDLLQLDPSTKRVTRTIEDWSSLIWTERYNDFGEFQLQSTDPDYHMALMPKGSYIGLRDSDQPMRVETHQIDIDDQGKSILTASGRAAESVLEDRTTLATIVKLGTGGNLVSSLKIPNLAIGIMGLISYQVNDPDYMFPVEADRITDFTTAQEFYETTFPNYDWPSKFQQLDEAVYQMLKQCNYGLRGIRPKGTASKLVISLYKGTDKTATVIFRSQLGDIKPKQYLFSIKGKKNVAYIQTTNGAATVLYPGLSTAPTGLARRDLLVDGSDIPNGAGATLNNLMKAKAQGELLTHPEITSFDFEVVPNGRWKYHTDYFLGDVVKVRADYGLSENMRVTEFIRSEDKTGYKEFPTLAVDVPAEYV